MSIHIVVPDERAQQLRQLAAAHDTTVADAIGILINHAISAGVMPKGVPGIEVTRIKDGVAIDLGTFAKKLKRDYAKRLAELLRAPDRPGYTSHFTGMLHIARRGGGIKIIDRESSTSVAKVLAPSVAHDLADLIDAAASPTRRKGK